MTHTVDPPERTRHDPGRRARRRAAPAVRRHRVYFGLIGLAVLAVLVLVPVLPSTPHAPGPSPTPVAAVPPGVTPPTPAYGTGTTVGGVRCGPGRRQVTWSVYAPACQPAWHGRNGGATSLGVTGSTITVAYRVAPVSQLMAQYPFLPAGILGLPAQEVATIDAYLAVFNRDFELYGRRVVLVPYGGTSDLLDGGPAGDARDATYVATTLRAFADLSLGDSGPIYTADLTARHVVSLDVEATTEAAYAAASPYQYSPGPNCTKGATATAAVLGRQLAGLDAARAGDADLTASVRRYGMLFADSTTGAGCSQAVEDDLAADHVAVHPVFAVATDLDHMAASAQAALLELRADRVTTVICSSCDPVMTLLAMRAADRLGYHPEWWLESDLAGGQTDTDALTRELPADQADHAISTGTPAGPAGSQEARRVLGLARPTPAAGPTVALIYQALLQLFDGLQLAGPDLTPAGLLSAMGRIPVSGPGGMFGPWRGRAGPYDPAAGFTVVAWDAATTSPSDGRTGAWVACDGGRTFAYPTAGRAVPARTPLECRPGTGRPDPGRGR